MQYEASLHLMSSGLLGITAALSIWHGNMLQADEALGRSAWPMRSVCRDDSWVFSEVQDGGRAPHYRSTIHKYAAVQPFQIEYFK